MTKATSERPGGDARLTRPAYTIVYTRTDVGRRASLANMPRAPSVPDLGPAILVLSPAVAPPRGGIAAATENVVRGLEKVGDVSLLAVSQEPVTIDRRKVFASGGTPLRRLVSRAKFATVAAATVVRARPDIVHAVTWRAAVPVALLPKRLRPTLIVHAHGTELVRSPVLAPLRNLVFRRADGIIAVSRYTAGAVHALTGRAATVVPPSANPPANGSVAATEKEDGAVRILSVGSLVARKGHINLLRAVNDARARGANCTLTIAGARGPEEGAISRLALDLDASSWLTVEVNVSAGRLAQLYGEADVFALMTRDGPREFEGFGIVFAEAGLAGLPIVAGRSGGTEDAVEDGHGAYLVLTEYEAAVTLTNLCANPELRRRMGSEGRRHAERFLPAVVDERLARLYSALIDNTRSHRALPTPNARFRRSGGSRRSVGR